MLDASDDYAIVRFAALLYNKLIEQKKSSSRGVSELSTALVMNVMKVSTLHKAIADG